MVGSKLLGATYDILRGIHLTLWCRVKQTKKIEQLVQIDFSGMDSAADRIAAKELTCKD